ncbi:hypothetical protein GINT2_001635 [Glugoides intestinalis]
MENHFLSSEKLSKSTGKKVDPDVVKGMQAYAEKAITDVLNRAALLSRHAGKDIIDASDISIVIEKDFDFSFGMRSLFDESHMPSNEHVERIAEISRQK